TLNRLELSRAEPSRYHKISYDTALIEAVFVDVFLDAHAVPPPQITLDLDATDDPLHGHQEGRFFHGYYDNYCYLPLYVFCGRQRGKPPRRLRDFTWQTRDSWSRQRRIIAKAEWLPGATPGTGEANPRFVVTSLSREEHEARHLYEKLSCARGEMENRIKSLPSRKRGNASLTSMPTAPRPRRCAPTSCGCGSPRWPMC